MNDVQVVIVNIILSVIAGLIGILRSKKEAKKEVQVVKSSMDESNRAVANQLTEVIHKVELVFENSYNQDEFNKIYKELIKIKDDVENLQKHKNEELTTERDIFQMKMDLNKVFVTIGKRFQKVEGIAVGNEKQVKDIYKKLAIKKLLSG